MAQTCRCNDVLILIIDIDLLTFDVQTGHQLQVPLLVNSGVSMLFLR